jgi:predicted nucleotidyltransferase
MASELKDHPILKKMLTDLEESLGERLHSVVLYGSTARGDYEKASSDLNLIVVLENLEPPTLEALEPAFTRWRKAGQPFPSIFSPTLIAESADVFPIEFFDISRRRIVLHGKDPFAELEIHVDHLRHQCERELREKMMRLREGFIETRGRSKALRLLLTESYPSFVALFRGCLHLLGEEVPIHNEEVVAAFSEQAELDAAPFVEVERLKRGETTESDPKTLFARYYEELTKAVHRVDRFKASS